MGFFNTQKNKCNRCNKFRFTELVGLMIAVIGALIVVMILPIKIWLLVLGVLLVILGCTLFKLL